MRKIFILTVMAFSLMLSFGNAFAGVLDERVTALEATVASQQSAIVSLQSALADLQTRLLAVENSPAVQMGTLGYLRLDTNERNGVIGPHVIFEGVNLHLQNGTGGSFGEGFKWDNPPNGLGNLIVGYDGIPNWQSPLEPGDRNGSHNLVIGHGNKFPGISGMVHGWNNTARGQFAATIAGDSNDAGGWSAIVGGFQNVIADELESVIVGGFRNNATTGNLSVITGGHENIVTGYSAVINGGVSNTAGNDSVVSGGQGNTAGQNAIVVGGKDNTASGIFSTITGGQNNTASGNYSSVSGGLQRTATGEHDWSAGGLWEDQ